MKYINGYLLIGSFILGLLYVYFTEPNYRDVPILPTPENINKYLVKDETDTCFRFKKIKTKCSKDTQNYPLQVREKKVHKSLVQKIVNSSMSS